MNKTICIYPKDETTDFLFPLYEALCSNGIEGWHDNTINNTKLIYDKIQDCKGLIFLGHGTSATLYGSPDNNLTDFITEKNVHTLLMGKPCFLLSCNSADFCYHYKLIPSIGFGNMPTGVRDVHAAMDSDASFPCLEQEDIDVYNKALVRSLTRAFSSSSLEDMHKLYTNIKLFANVEIVDCLLNRTCKMYRDVADLLQDLKNDCTLYYNI